MAAAAFLGVAIGVIVGGGLFWTARVVHIGNLDALALAEKMAVPDPVSALDWPELQVRTAIPQPDRPALVLLVVRWPEHPHLEATLLLAMDGDVTRSSELLERWRTSCSSIAPCRRGAARVELRRRRSLERVGGVLIAEDVGGTGQRCRS